MKRIDERGQSDAEMAIGAALLCAILIGLGYFIGWLSMGDDANRPYVDLQLTTTITVQDDTGNLHTVTFTEDLLGVEAYEVSYERPVSFVVTVNGGEGELALFADGRHKLAIVPGTMQTETTYVAKTLTICIPAQTGTELQNQVKIRSLVTATCPAPAE